MFQTVCFDFDSTLVSIEGIDVLADILEIPGIKEITDQAMNGEISTRDAFCKRLEMIAPTKRQLNYLADIYKAHLIPGVLEICQILKFLEKKIIIVSGGFQEAIEPVGKLLGVDETVALQLCFEENGKGHLGDSPLIYLDGKSRLLEVCGRLQGRSLFVGDGVTDYATREVVDKMVPYFGIARRPFVDESGLESYGGQNMLGLLALILTQEEWSRVCLEFPEWSRQISDLTLDSDYWLNLNRDLNFFRTRASRVFLVPGPTEIPLDIQSKRAPILAHRSSEFEDLYARNQILLRNFLDWDRPFLTVNGSATAMMEALLSSIAPSRVLACVSGSFGERFYKIAQRQGHQVTRIDSIGDRGFDVQQVLDSVNEHDVLLLTHNETSNGVLNPVEDIAAAVSQSNQRPLIFVDGVSSVGGIQLKCDFIDAILFGTQKCLALPPGLAFCAVSERLQEVLRTCNPRSFYLDLKATLQQHAGSNVPFTPAVDLFQSLELQLNKFVKRGAEHFNWYARRAQLVWEFCEQHNLEIFAHKDFRSLTVSSVRLPGNAKDLRKTCAAKSVILAGGYGPQAETHFRIGHMGEISMEQIKLAFKTIEECL